MALAASLGASSNVQERWRQAFVVMLGFSPPLRRHAEPSVPRDASWY